MLFLTPEHWHPMKELTTESHRQEPNNPTDHPIKQIPQRQKLQRRPDDHIPTLGVFHTE